MCKDCLFEVRPDVESHVTDSGANMLNYKGCINCKQVTLLKSVEVSRETEDDEDNDIASEELRFERMFQSLEFYLILPLFTMNVFADHVSTTSSSFPL